MFSTLLTIILLLSTISSGLKPDDICHSTKIKCNPSTNICSQVDCPDAFSFDCGSNICSVDKDSCEDYQYMITNIQSMKLIEANTLELVRGFVFLKKRLKNFERLINEIKNCPVEKYEWTASDVCLNNQKCFDWISEKCPCKGEFGLRCNENLCGRHKEACDGLSEKMPEEITDCIE